MRGAFVDQGGLFSYISPEARVPPDHPLRKIRELIREVLSELNRSLGKLYASEGRPSIPPEQLLSALLLQVFYGIRSERQLIEQLNYNFLYRWFVGLSPDDTVWVPTTFTKNRERLQNGEMFAKFMTKLLNHPQDEAVRQVGHRLPRELRPDVAALAGCRVVRTLRSARWQPDLPRRRSSRGISAIF